MATTNTGKISGTLALGLTFDTSDTRKFSLDVTALTKVTCEMVAVPPPRQLMALADRWAGVATTKTVTTDEAGKQKTTEHTPGAVPTPATPAT